MSRPLIPRSFWKSDLVHLRRIPCNSSTAPVLQRTLKSRRTYSTEKNEQEQLDFKNQLWQSSTDRVQREKQEQARFAEQRRKQNAKGTGAATTGAVLIASAVFYYFGSMTGYTPPTASTLPLSSTEPLSHDVSSSNLQAAWSDLRRVVGNDNVSTSESDLISHAGSSWSSYSDTPSDRPFCIVRPASTDEVSAIMHICHRRHIPVVAYGGGTSLEGHYAASRGGICIDFSRMDQIISLHVKDLDVVVQPAVDWQSLNDELNEHGLFFPPDPGPGAQIGGMVGTGCSGTNAYRYGTMREWVLSLTVVMADGTIIKTRQRPRKSSAGYDLTKTFIGSEGTLGLVTEATLRLTSAPQNPRVAVAAFTSIREAAECVSRVVKQGVPIAAVELLDDKQMQFINDAGSTTKKWAQAPTLFFKFSGTLSGVKESISQVQSMAKSTGSKSFAFARDEIEAAELWSARKEALWSVMAQIPSDKDIPTHVWTTDVAVPISRLPDIVEVTKSDIAQSGLTGSIVGHVGDGNFHAILLYDSKTRRSAEDVVHRMVERAIEMEGTATGEHGVGLVKRDYLGKELGQGTVDAMRALKKAWDPLCLLNCDKVVRAVKPKPGEAVH